MMVATVIHFSYYINNNKKKPVCKTQKIDILNQVRSGVLAVIDGLCGNDYYMIDSVRRQYVCC